MKIFILSTNAPVSELLTKACLATKNAIESVHGPSNTILKFKTECCTAQGRMRMNNDIHANISSCIMLHHCTRATKMARINYRNAHNAAIRHAAMLPQREKARPVVALPARLRPRKWNTRHACPERRKKRHTLQLLRNSWSTQS